MTAALTDASGRRSLAAPARAWASLCHHHESGDGPGPGAEFSRRRLSTQCSAPLGPAHAVTVVVTLHCGTGTVTAAETVPLAVTASVDAAHWQAGGKDRD